MPHLVVAGEADVCIFHLLLKIKNIYLKHHLNVKIHLVQYEIFLLRPDAVQISLYLHTKYIFIEKCIEMFFSAFFRREVKKNISICSVYLELHNHATIVNICP